MPDARNDQFNQTLAPEELSPGPVEIENKENKNIQTLYNDSTTSKNTEYSDGIVFEESNRSMFKRHNISKLLATLLIFGTFFSCVIIPVCLIVNCYGNQWFENQKKKKIKRYPKTNQFDTTTGSSTIRSTNRLLLDTLGYSEETSHDMSLDDEQISFNLTSKN